MNREIEVEKTTTETEEVSICDKCGLEAPNGTSLTSRARTRDAALSIIESEESLKYQRVSLTDDDVKRILVDAFRHTPSVLVCGDCEAEMFDWRNTDD